ncbi:WAP four-disulfide core domain protein 2 [Suncus etruscus]|uniref:WAP four-disulfide core domain protein 2 n=1 Tax=Suncus etruscus TaxID=109475 RepID=UPI002110C925|nr:WAP four-disulfide core domain protein 2 [Suncus etruscus]
MPARRLCPLAGVLLLGLGLLLLGVPEATGEGMEKQGVCPPLEENSNCTQKCHSDGDCADNLKCCPAGCANVCHLPNEKPGSCPQVDGGIPKLGVCEDQCKTDSECPGNMKCCRNGCGNVSCATPA